MRLFRLADLAHAVVPFKARLRRLLGRMAASGSKTAQRLGCDLRRLWSAL